eukprot:scaffold29075_cov60-Phaeocystis_antarctica.AAC.2
MAQHDEGTPSVIYHVVQQSAWDAAQAAGEYFPPRYDKDGFIHATHEAAPLLSKTHRPGSGRAGLPRPEAPGSPGASLTTRLRDVLPALQALLLGVLNFKHPTLGYIHREIKVYSSPGSTQVRLRALTAHLLPFAGDLPLPRHRHDGAHVAREDGGGRREGGPGGTYRLPAHLRADRATELRHQTAARPARGRWRLPLDRWPVSVDGE